MRSSCARWVHARDRFIAIDVRFIIDEGEEILDMQAEIFGKFICDFK